MVSYLNSRPTGSGKLNNTLVWCNNKQVVLFDVMKIKTCCSTFGCNENKNMLTVKK